MRLDFDRGTVVLRELPPGLSPDALTGVLWDPRVGVYRAPARLLYPLLSELRRHDVDVPVPDRPRPKLAPPSGFRPVVLRPYQSAALAAWRLAGRRGVVVLPTGAGKTRVAIAAMSAVRAAVLCLVPTRALLEQWCVALADFYDGPIGRFGDGQRALEPLTVATFASAYRHMATLGDQFGLVVVDEAHHFGGGVHDEALEMAIAPLRLGLTATPAADRARQVALMGPVVFELGICDLAGEHLAPFERVTWWLTLSPEERDTYDTLARMYRDAFRAFRGGRRGRTWEEFLREAARTDEGRVAIAAWRRASRLLAYPACKRAALATLLDRHRGRRTLVFVGHNETAYAVAREHLVPPLTCETGRDERAHVLEQFRRGGVTTLVSAQVLNEGIDVPDAEVGIIVAGRLGAREHIQRIGRLLRPTPGKRAMVYELVIERSSETRQAERRGSALASRK